MINMYQTGKQGEGVIPIPHWYEFEIFVDWNRMP